MKILLTFLTFGKNVFAGMENAAYNFTMGVKEIGHDVIIFTSKAYGDTDTIDNTKVYRSEYLPIKFVGGDTEIKQSIRSNRVQILQELRKIVDTESPEILVAWDPLWGFIQYLEPLNIRIQSVLIFHVVNDQETLRDAKNHPYSLVFAVSDFLKHELTKACGFEDIHLLPNSLDIDAIRNVSKNTELKRKIIFCNARLSPEKGIEYAIEGFSSFIRHHHDYELWLCSGPFPFGDVNVTKQKMVSLVNDLQISRYVKFLPNLPWKDIPGIIANSFAVVIPSLMESFGLAALEAMACGTPVIATRVGNLPNLVQGNGLLVKPRSSYEIEKALAKLAGNPDLYHTLRQKGALAAQEYDRKRVAKTFILEVTNLT